MKDLLLKHDITSVETYNALCENCYILKVKDEYYNGVEFSDEEQFDKDNEFHDEAIKAIAEIQREKIESVNYLAIEMLNEIQAEENIDAIRERLLDIADKITFLTNI